MRARRSMWPFALGLAAWAGAFALALGVGAVDGADIEIISQLRLPRAVLASAVGMGLALAGAILQAVFANPLCEPYILGISSGSTLGAVIGASLGIPLAVSGIAGSAFIGAFVFTAILYVISLRPGRGNLSILLAGVMLGLLGSSLVAVWMALADPNGIQAAIGWLLGDLSRARPEGALFSLFAVLTIGILIWFRWRSLDALLMGDEGARSLGVDVATVRRRMVFATSLIIAICVSGGGMIGFVGIMVPHFCRRIGGSLHLRLLPLCAIWGAAALTAADCLARVVARPYELPVGVVTALAGAPLFLWVLLKRDGGFAGDRS